MCCPDCRSPWVIPSADALKCGECGAVFARRLDQRRESQGQAESPMPRWLSDRVALRRAIEAIRVS